MVVGTGRHTYELVPGWGSLPEGWSFGQVAGVAVDSRDRVYLFNRTAHPVLVFDRDGTFLASWGEGLFRQPHGIFIDASDHVYCVDRDAHAVHKFTAEGRHLLTIGTPGQPGGEKLSGRPFNLPAGVAVGRGGEVYVADGYGNARVHKYAPDGRHLLSWGSPGDGPGQFNLPHGVWVDGDGAVLVCDRENHRIQRFTPEGEHLATWTGFVQPAHLYVDAEGFVYVAELRRRVSVLTREGTLLARWGDEEGDGPGRLTAPHGIWADSRGDLYVGEVLQGQTVRKYARR